ncbi:MAG: VIT domain-containing protein [Deltaproteobacteria bacterium]|nr:VIT domain-containing protein [Deltaproteobacteria bacterium]
MTATRLSAWTYARWNIAVLATTMAACRGGPSLEQSVGQVDRVRAGVVVVHARAEREVHRLERLASQDLVRVDHTGRATVSLDGGGRLVLDHDTHVRVQGAREATLERGRLWVAGSEGSRNDVTRLQIGTTLLLFRGARASVTEHSGHAIVSVLAGEVSFESGTRRGAVRTGETGDLSAQAVNVAPHRAYDDWTGGLADDIPRSGADAAGLGSVAARTPGETGQPRWPMVMQRLESWVVVRGDLAITTLEQTFFNPSSDTVEGLYTFQTPPGAVLQMFGVDRRGQIVEGIVRERQQAAAQYQAQVYRGSTHDPALLEWDAPGRYHAKLYPIAGGSTRRVRVRYAQWLTPDAQGRSLYRLPLASLDSRIGELRADFDLEDAQVAMVRSGGNGRVEDKHLLIAQSDVLPRADLVVELNGAARGPVSAQRVPQAGDPRGGYLRVAVHPPIDTSREIRDEGVDLVVVVDHSAATDDQALRLEQAFVESLLASLDERDSVLVLAGDVATRPIGSERAELQPVTADRRRAISEALARDSLGGATDLGAMIGSAHRALRPGRNGAIVYVGDGQATVGEADLPALRAATARLSPRPRFYAVAVGEAPRLEVLDGIASPAGISRRITARGDVAATVQEVLTHASRPLVRNVRVDLGPLVTAVYPSEGVDLPVGEPLTVVGRYPGDAPRSVTVRAMFNGREVQQTYALSAPQVNDGDDLKYRWASARLEHLLARGESRAVIVELGTRFGLITPYTSLYVPSEDEVSARDRLQRQGQEIPTALAQLELADFFPLVGCSRSSSARPESSGAVVSSVETNDQPGMAAPPATVQVNAEPRSARYAIRNYGVAPNEPAPPPQAAPSTVAAATTPMAPSEPEPEMAAAPAAVVPTLQQAAQGARRAERQGGEEVNGVMPGDAIGDSFGFGGLGTVGTGSANSTESTTRRAPGMGGGTGSGYGQGSGRAVRERFARDLSTVASDGETDIQNEDRRSNQTSHRAVLNRAMPRLRQCHAQALAEDLSVSGRMTLRVVVGGGGNVMVANIVQTNYPVASVAACVVNTVNSLEFPATDSGRPLSFVYPIRFDATGRSTGTVRPSTSRAELVSRCSDAARIPLVDRVPLWRERVTSANAQQLLALYRQARRTCEARSWSEQVALLGVLWSGANTLDGQLNLYRVFEGQGAQQRWLRARLLRTLARSGQLARAQELGLGRLDANTMAQALGVATSPAQRLSVLAELARRYPDDMELSIRFLDEALAQRDVAAVRTQASRMRAHPQADGRIRTLAGEALFAIGDQAEARRCFSEIVEFAPDDANARRRLGDIALSHGWADEAYRQFQMLAVIENEAPEVLLRQAMAAKMAGRLDEALRLAERVAQEYASGNGTLGDVASAWIGTELALAASAPGAQRSTIDALRARWRVSSAARGAGALRVIVRWLHPDDGAELYLQMPGESPRRSDWVSGAFFFESTVFADAPGPLALEVRRSDGARSHGTVELLLLFNEGQASERIERRTLELTESTPGHVFDLREGALTARPAGASLVSAPTVEAGVAAQAATGRGAR